MPHITGSGFIYGVEITSRQPGEYPSPLMIRKLGAGYSTLLTLWWVVMRIVIAPRVPITYPSITFCASETDITAPCIRDNLLPSIIPRPFTSSKGD
ncbi:hypothetical protein KCP75_03760 [Salmonella enterica subsp. enterica]|nr:hypothetical protein KCP75_03760 [Salmonella enterica subsp. enterica]